MAKKEKTVNRAVKSKPKYQKQIGLKIPVGIRNDLLKSEGGVSSCIRREIVKNIDAVSKSPASKVNSVAALAKGEQIAINFRIDSDLYDKVRHLSYKKSSTITSIVINCLALGGLFDGIN